MNNTAIGGLLIGGTPLLLAAISIGFIWLDQRPSFTLGVFVEWLVNCNAALATLAAAVGGFFLWGDTAIQKGIGIVLGAIGGFLAYIVVGSVVVFMLGL